MPKFRRYFNALPAGAVYMWAVGGVNLGGNLMHFLRGRCQCRRLVSLLCRH